LTKYVNLGEQESKQLGLKNLTRIVKDEEENNQKGKKKSFEKESNQQKEKAKIKKTPKDSKQEKGHKIEKNSNKKQETKTIAKSKKSNNTKNKQAVKAKQVDSVGKKDEIHVSYEKYKSEHENKNKHHSSKKEIEEKNKHHHTKLSNIHDKLVEEYSDVVNYRKDLSKVHKMFSNEKEAVTIGSNIIRCDHTLNYLEKLIKYTRFSLMSLKFNNHLNQSYNQGLLKIIKKLEDMKGHFRKITSQNKDIQQDEVASIKSKINKLSELYKYMKKGAIHDFIRNQILKRIVNMNLSVLSNIDMKKQLSCLKMKKDLLDSYVN